MQRFFVAVAAVCLVVLAMCGSGDEELARQHDDYCQMVQIFEETGGQRGWPDYNGNAAEVCGE